MLYNLKIENNIFAPDITKVNLLEKEIEYIYMLISGVGRKKAINLLSLSLTDLGKLYLKFGLTDSTKLRYVQIVTIFMINKLVDKNILLKIYNIYNLIECKNLTEYLY